MLGLRTDARFLAIKNKINYVYASLCTRRYTQKIQKALPKLNHRL